MNAKEKRDFELYQLKEGIRLGKIKPEIFFTYNKIKKYIEKNQKEYLFSCKYLGEKINLIDTAGDGQSPLSLAIIYNRFEFVKELISYGADVNLLNPVTERNAFMLACKYKHFSIAKYLLDNGTDINHIDISGFNALHYASSFMNKSMIENVIKLGLDVNSKTNEGQTALSFSFGEDEFTIPIIKNENHDYRFMYLISIGADVNVVDNNGITPLMQAIYEKDSYAASKLIDMDVNLDLISNTNKTAYDIAKQRGLADIADKIYIKKLANLANSTKPEPSDLSAPRKIVSI